ncbi:MAG: alanine/ornithine racemase family PLP-dependent enzyme [Oscillospiraceae bacterium]|nr:alanine/ornithine racemase family PLP-dependent enzyme [Oscillospiraceae bacterium]
MYPRVIVNREHLKENVRVMKALCEERGIQITGVTKVFRADPAIAAAYLEAGLTMLGDSRVANLKRLEGLQAEKWLIRPPMLSEVEDLVRYADASLNSEWEVIRAIAAAARRQGKCHKVVLMADLGDIREGYVDYDELLEVAQKTEALEGVELYGLGVNLTCFSFIQSSTEKLTQLADLAEKAGQLVGRKLPIVSGGNSATVHLMLQGGVPAGVNCLRLGESLLFGKERAKYQYLPGTHRDVFTLECEIVEVKDKPSLPWGEVGVDSYGNKPTFVDRGPCRRKAVCALGKQDFDVETTVPEDPGIIMLGASSDHLMLDITDSEKDYRVGDIVRLQLGYFSTMRAFTSEYVEKVYLG